MAAVVASVSSPSASSTTSVAVPAAAAQDLRCLTLALVATSEAKEQAKQAAIAEAWYFMGRLDAEVPGIDLKPALTGVLEAMNKNPHTRDIGVACDAEFVKRGADLRNLVG